MNFFKKRTMTIAMALMMLFAILEPLPLNALAETMTSTDNVSESVDNAEKFDSEIETKDKVEISDKSEGSQKKLEQFKTPTRTTETDQKWFTFNGNTITGYSSSAEAPMDIVIPTTYIKNDITYDVTAIGNGVFSGRQLNTVVLNNNLQTIGSSAFANNTKLTNIVIPDSVTSIGASAFSGCTSLASATLSNNLTSIPNNLFYQAGLTSIEIPENVKTIGSSAFSKSKLNTVNLPSSMESIGSYAFSYNLFTTITIPEGIEYISGATFSGCSNLKSVFLPKTLKNIGYDAFSACYALESITLPDKVESINSRAFSSSGLKEIIIGASIKTIESDAFLYLDNPKIKFKNKQVNEISGAPWQAQNAQIYWTSDDSTPFYFKGGVIYGFKPLDHDTIQSDDITEGYKKADIPAQINGVNVTAIADNAFAGIKTLTMITLPNTLTTIGNASFKGCRLTSLELGDNVTSIGESAFEGNSTLSQVVFGSGINNIGDGAFSATESRIKIKLELKEVNSVTGSPWGASAAQIYWRTEDTSCFYFDKSTGTLLGFKPLDHTVSSEHTHSNNHTVASIPNEINGVTVTKIANQAFKGVPITSLTLPNTITEIGDYAFYQTKLTELEIPSSVISAGEYCFAQTSTLRAVTIPGSLSVLPAYMFFASGTAPMTVTLNEGLIEIGTKAFASAAINTIEFPNSLETIGQESFQLSELTNVTIPFTVKNIGVGSFYSCKKLTTVNLPRNMTRIPQNMFRSCGALKNIAIPNTVTRIDQYSFNGAGLTSINLPENLSYIGVSAFGGTLIEEVVIPEKVTKLPSSVFADCAQLKKVVLPNTFTEIGYRCFFDCALLENINIPNSLKVIDDYAFYRCNSLVKLNLNEGLETIGEYSIDGANISELELPSTMKTMKSSSLKGYKGSRLLIRQPRSSSPISSTQPWGSGLSFGNILYQGEYTELKGNVVYSQNYNNATIHLEVSAMSDSIIKTITLPDGTEINNVDTNTHSLSFDVNMNGSYTFSATSISGDSREITINVDEIVYAILEAQDFTIAASEVASLTNSKIIEEAKAKGTNNLNGVNLSVLIETSLTTIKNALTAPDKSVQVVLYVNVSLPDGSGNTIVKKTINIYTAKEFLVTFKDWNDTVLKTENVFEGDSAIPPTDPTRKGYSFIGWDKPLVNILADTTFKAQYTQNEYIVSYDTGGASPSNLPNKTVSWDEGNLLPSASLSKNHYIFSNWYVQGLQLVISNATKYSDLVDDDSIMGVTLRAKWTPISYTLSFDANGGNGPTKENITFNVENNTINVGSHQFYKEGCTFAGWNTKADGSGISVDSNANYKPVLENTTLYAQWVEQGPSYYVEIPKSIRIENEKDSNYASATQSIRIIDASVNEGTMPNKSIEILCDSSITLTNEENDDTYHVDVYDALGEKYIDSTQPLMILNNSSEEAKASTFKLTTAKNIKNKLSTYHGVMRFTVRFGG